MIYISHIRMTMRVKEVADSVKMLVPVYQDAYHEDHTLRALAVAC
jgi:hypothetical protein